MKKGYKLPKKSFALYESASIHIKPKKAVPARLYFSIAALLGAPVVLWNVGSTVAAKYSPVAAVEVPVPAVAPVSVAAVPAPVVSPAADPVPGVSKPVMVPVNLVSQFIDWSLISACLENSVSCVCYGKSAERLVVPLDSCKLAVKHGWPGV